MKRLLDVCGALCGLACASPCLMPVLLLVWLQDFRSPFYVAPRVGLHGRRFNMVKVRSMVAGADTAGVDSTAADDPRITAVGRFVRAYKIDEMTQLWNVVRGEMSLVGPRPNVPREVALYTDAERGLLTVPPGMTDIASIVFADEGEVLQGHPDPDIAYHQVIRPWKNRLGLFYVAHRSLWLDLRVVGLTAVALFSRSVALRGVQGLLRAYGAEASLVAVAGRQQALVAAPPPGATDVVRVRGVA